jgi:hypothetical protein
MVAVLYWLLTTAVAIGMAFLERRFANRGARGNVGPGSRKMNAPLAASHP